MIFWFFISKSPVSIFLDEIKHFYENLQRNHKIDEDFLIQILCYKMFFSVI